MNISGLCRPPRQWTQRQPPADSGTLLRDELGFTPYYLRYNSGLAVATNGKALAEALLDQLYTQHPVPIEEILMIAHSIRAG